MPTTIRLFNQQQVFKRVILEDLRHCDNIPDYIMHDNVMYSRWSGRGSVMEYKQISEREQLVLYTNWIANQLKVPESSSEVRMALYDQSKVMAAKFLTEYGRLEVKYDKREESDSTSEVQDCPTDR